MSDGVPLIDRAAYGAAWIAAHALGLLGRPVEERLLAARDRVRRRINRRLGEGRAPRTLAVPRVPADSVAALRRVMQRRAAPMVLAGAARDWRCRQTWTPRWGSPSATATTRCPT